LIPAPKLFFLLSYSAFMPNLPVDASTHLPLIEYINRYLERRLTEEEMEHVRSQFQFLRIKKHRLFLEEGQICERTGFVIKGSFKQYSVDADGKEHVFQLCLENWWIGDRESFTTRTPSPYFIEALEDSEVLILNGSIIEQGLEKMPFLKELWRVIMERQSLRLMRRLQNLKTLSSEQRLFDLEQAYPEFFQRFPLHLIASYLGMTKETLSRIRAARAAGG
jgi:CRP-like cAMP-binding protein